MLSLDSVTANAAWGKLEEDKEKHHWQIRLKKKKKEQEENDRRDAIDQAHVHAQVPTKLSPPSALHPSTLPPCCHAVVLDSSKVLLSPSRVPAGKPRGLCSLGTGDKRTERQRTEKDGSGDRGGWLGKERGPLW